MACGSVDRLRVARSRPVTAAIVRRAEMRAALDHLPGNPDVRQRGVVAVVLAPAARILAGCSTLSARRPRASANTSRSSTPRRCRYPFYPRKLNALFYEFEEIGCNVRLGYASPADVADQYPRFFWNKVEPFVGDAFGYVELTVEGPAMDREPLLQRVRDRAWSTQNGAAGKKKTQCGRRGRCSCRGATETSSWQGRAR